MAERQQQPAEKASEKVARRKAEKTAAVDKLLGLTDAKLGARVRAALQRKRAELNAQA